MQIRSHFYQLLSANTLVALFGLLAGIILARNLSVVDRGQLAEIFLWTSLGVTIGSESLREYILSLKEKESKVNLKTIILSAAIAITLPIILIVENGYKEYVYYSIIFSLLNFFSLIYLSKVQINGDFRRLSIYKVVVPLINFVILLASFYFSVGIWFALCSLLLSNLSLLVIISLNESFIAFSNTNKVSGYLNVLFSVIIITLVSQMDRIIIAKVSSAQEMAYFMISLTIFVTPLTIAGQSISNYVVIHIKNVKSELNKYIDNILFLSLLILGLAAIVLYVFSHWIIVSLFGDKYIPSIAYGLLCASISILSNMRVIYIGCLRGLGLNWPVSIFQSIMLMSLVVIYVLYLNLSLDISQVLWGFIILQTIFFTTFYMFNRFKYLRYHKQIQ